MRRYRARELPPSLDAVTDELPVVTVTYSPGPHLERFLSSLTVATDLPVRVVMADNGSTDGAPEAAGRRYSNARCCAPAPTSATAVRSTVPSPNWVRDASSW